MESNRAKALVAIGSIALVVVLFVVLSGGDDEPTPATTAATPATTITDPGDEGGVGSGGQSGGGQDEAGGTPATPAITKIVVKGGEPVDGIADLQYSKGEEVRFAVTADVPEEVHIHGYDLMQDLEPGKTARFAFPAEIDGVFEIELENSATQIAQLTVKP